MRTVRQEASDPMRDLPTTTDALLRELVAQHEASARARDLGIPAQQLAMHAGLPDPDCDRALAALEADGMVKLARSTMGYTPTARGIEASGYNVLADAAAPQEWAA